MKTECPECGAGISPFAKTCRCGWSAAGTGEKPRREHVQCAHEGCQDCAIVRQKTEAGWANLCARHYDAFHLKRAEAKLLDLGLEFYAGEETRQQWHARLMEYIRTKPINLGSNR